MNKKVQSNEQLHLYFLRSIILAKFDYLRNSICYYDRLYIKLYISENYKNLML